MSLYQMLDAVKDTREAEEIGRAIRNWRKKRQKTLEQALEEGIQNELPVFRAKQR